MKKKILAIALTAALAFGSVFSLTACGEDSSNGSNTDGKASSITIAIPNDATNGGRALLLLESLGYIQVKDSAGITATVLGVVGVVPGGFFIETGAASREINHHLIFAALFEECVIAAALGVLHTVIGYSVPFPCRRICFKLRVL